MALPLCPGAIPPLRSEPQIQMESFCLRKGTSHFSSKLAVPWCPMGDSRLFHWFGAMIPLALHTSEHPSKLLPGLDVTIDPSLQNNWPCIPSHCAQLSESDRARIHSSTVICHASPMPNLQVFSCRSEMHSDQGDMAPKGLSDDLQRAPGHSALRSPQGREIMAARAC